MNCYKKFLPKYLMWLSILSSPIILAESYDNLETIPSVLNRQGFTGTCSYNKEIKLDWRRATVPKFRVHRVNSANNYVPMPYTLRKEADSDNWFVRISESHPSAGLSRGCPTLQVLVSQETE